MPWRLKVLIVVSGILLIVALSAIAFAKTTKKYTYDELNRLVKVEYGSDTTITYTCDVAGSRLTMNAAVECTTDTITVSPGRGRRVVM